MKKLFLLSIILFSAAASAQKGTIRGTVIEDATGQTIIGANVVVLDPLMGSSTDLDGKFSIEIDPGTYTLKVSFISFEDIIIKDVIVTAGKVNVIGNIRLRESSLELGEVVISATATRKSEAAINTMKQKSVAMMDGISAEKMALTGDATAVEAAKRVTGVSIEGGKYIYVRGLGDRYSKVTLNNVDIPGLDPDKNSLQMDIFPSNLIDNILVSKNFTADMPADFTGGILNIETKAFPDERILDVSLSTSFNPDMHFNSNYLAYEGGKTDFLGFDNGSRALPQGARSTNIPTPISGASDQQVSQFVNGFDPTLGASRETSFLDYSLSASFGNQVSLGKNNESWSAKNPKLGYIFSLSYKTEYKYYDEVEYGEYQRDIDPDISELTLANKQTGELSEKSVLIGGLAGLAYKTNLSKVRLAIMHLQNGESRSGKFFIENNPAGVGQSGYIATSDNLEYNQRSLTNLLINGKHVLKDSGWEIDWRISPTLSTSEDPDIRKTAYTLDRDRFRFDPGQGGLPSRIWRSLNETNLSSKGDISRDYKLFDEDAKLKFGVAYNYKQRDYEILQFDLQLRSSNTQQWPNADPNNVLTPENIYPNRPNGVYYQSGNSTPNPNAYESNINNLAFYASNEMSLNSNLKTILGLRVENYVQRHTGRDQVYASGNLIEGKNLDNEKVLESLDLFPSVNFIYTVAEEQNLRVAYSKTIARPSFKELSFAQIVDPITNRIFNGSLFQYEDWDGNLSETRIDNFDIRWEKFMERGQIFSASVFFKLFDNPIELVRIPTAQTTTEFQPRNVGNGQLLGIELEATKSLEFVSEDLKNWSVSGNLTLVKSEIDMTNTEFDARLNYEKTGQTISRKRPMAGQAPYVVNFGLSYNNLENGLTAGIFYNVKGPALEIVGVGLYPDIYQQPFHSLNLGINKKLGEDRRTAIDFKISNILNDKRESFYESFEAESQIFTSINPGRSFGVGISHKF